MISDLIVSFDSIESSCFINCVSLLALQPSKQGIRGTDLHWTCASNSISLNSPHLSSNKGILENRCSRLTHGPSSRIVHYKTDPGYKQFYKHSSYFFSLWFSVSFLSVIICVFAVSPSTERMDEAAKLTAEMADHRKRRDKVARSLQRLHTQILDLQRSEEFEALSAANVTDRGTDYSNLHFRLSNYMDLLLDEEEEDLADADAVVKRSFLTQHDQAKRVISKLVAIKMTTKLSNILETKLHDMEQMKVENPGRDYSACYHPLDTLAEHNLLLEE